MAPDPYRVLGLPADASIAEVKRAYRRLAKANHPDSAGEAALPRFLEIQRAYESITTVAWRPGTRRPAAATASEPWRADPARARTARGTSSGAGPGSTSGRGRPAGAAGSAEKAGPATGSGSGSGRRRSAKKATFGSTTYDEAREQADTTWSGASWYGPTSGEYWRVNPREYADPRKHGPEYLAKAAARAAAAAERRARQDAAAAASQPRGGGASASAKPRPRHASTGPSPGATEPPRPPSRTRSEPTSDGPRARTETGAPAEPQPMASTATAAEPASGDAPFGIVLTPGLRRIIRALLAWPPLGIAAAAVIGEATGCASFEATCTPTADLYPWVAQAAIVVGLLALPAIARILAGGTIAVALLAFPVAAVLSAGGASYDRAHGPAALIAVLAVVWAGGVAAVLVRRAITRPIP